MQNAPIVVALIVIAVLGCARPDTGSSRTNTSPTAPVAESEAIATPTPTPVVDLDKESADHRTKFLEVLKKADPKKQIVKEVRAGLTPDHLVLVVTNNWHYEPYQMRLQLAQTLWEGWARIHSPQEPDKARLKLVDLRDNEVGGSRVWAGSMIWVNE